MKTKINSSLLSLSVKQLGLINIRFRVFLITFLLAGSQIYGQSIFNPNLLVLRPKIGNLFSNYNYNSSGIVQTQNSIVNSIFIAYSVDSIYKKYPSSNDSNLGKTFIIRFEAGNLDSLRNSLLYTQFFDYVNKEFSIEFMRSRMNTNSTCPNPITPRDYNYYTFTALDFIDAKCAWSITTGSPDLKIAVIDGGLPSTIHEDLIGRTTAMTSGSVGFHPTATSGIICGKNDNVNSSNQPIGITSLGYNLRTMNYDILSTFSGGTSNEYNLILQAAKDGAKVINISLILNQRYLYKIDGDDNANTYPSYLIDFADPIMFPGNNFFQQINDAQTIIDEIHNMGVTIIVAAGNGIAKRYSSGTLYNWEGPPDANGDPRAGLSYPASFNHVISVSGWDPISSTFSGSGHQHNSLVDILAPSNHVPVINIDVNSINGYGGNGTGTSFAAPLVAATVGLMLSVKPCLTPDEIENILKITSTPISDANVYPGQTGSGLLNVYKAVQMANDWGTGNFTVNNGDNLTWNALHSYKNIYIKSGGTLTLNSTYLYMGSNGNIVIEAGGKLFVNNSTISALPVTSSSCNTVYHGWYGIQVQGNQTLSQIPANQGLININNNSVIRDAQVAVVTYALDQYGNYDWSKIGGGIIIASNSLFTNNGRHIAFMSYHAPLNSYGIEPNNKSSFNSCIFETDQTNIIANGRGYQTLFTNWGTKNITVTACTFRNTNGGANMNVYGADHGTGIYTVDASMLIQDYTNYAGVSTASGYFNDLQIGIRDDHTIGNPMNGHIIKKQYFNGDIYGIQQTNSSSSHIYRNTFKMEYPGFYPSYTKSGFWGINAGGFQISENYFYNSTSSYFNEIGSTFNNSNVSGGGLYMLNTHTAVNVGGQTELQNQNLNYKCNSHNNQPFAGIALNPKYPPDPMAYLPFFGDISSNQPIDKGNKFSNNIWDINNYTNASKEYDKINLNDRPHAPLCTFMSLFIIISPPDACLPFEPNGLSVNTCCPQDGAKINFMYVKKAGLVHDILPISNGASQSLLSLIAQGSSVSASDLYAALGNASPYLSDAVMIAMLQTSQHLTETQVVNILVTNSALTQAVLSALSYRNLTQNALNTINQAQSSVSSREIQEAKIAQDQRDVSDARVDLVNYYLSGNLLDTINNYTDSLKAFLVNETDELSIKQLASIYVEQGQTSLASQELNLLDGSSTENSNFIALMNVLIALKNDGKNVFQMLPAQEQTIRSIAATSTITAFNAQSILGLVFGEYIIKRPIQIVQTFGKKGNSTTGVIENTIANKNILSVYPNPAANYATVEYLMNNSVKSGKIIVSTIDGATVQIIDLKQKSGQYELDLRTLSAGVYFIELIGDDAILSVKKLIVTKN